MLGNYTSRSRNEYTGTVVWGHGPDQADLLLIGERPGLREAREGLPFVGPAGQDLDMYLAAAGLDRAEIYVTNLVKTFQNYEKPTGDEITEWLPYLWNEINCTGPRTIALMGSYAVEALMSAWWPGGAGLSVRHGIPWRLPVSNVVVVPTFHPAYGLYDEARKEDLFWDFQQVGKAHRGEIAVEWIDSIPSDDLVGILVRQRIEDGVHDPVPKPMTLARKLVRKSTWGRAE